MSIKDFRYFDSLLYQQKWATRNGYKVTSYLNCKDNEGIKHKLQADGRLKRLVYIKTTWPQRVNCKDGGVNKPNSIYITHTFSLYIILKWKENTEVKNLPLAYREAVWGCVSSAIFHNKKAQNDCYNYYFQMGFWGQWNQARISYVWSARAAKCLNLEPIFKRIKYKSLWFSETF